MKQAVPDAILSQQEVGNGWFGILKSLIPRVVRDKVAIMFGSAEPSSGAPKVGGEKAVASVGTPSIGVEPPKDSHTLSGMMRATIERGKIDPLLTQKLTAILAAIEQLIATGVIKDDRYVRFIQNSIKDMTHPDDAIKFLYVGIYFRQWDANFYNDLQPALRELLLG